MGELWQDLRLGWLKRGSEWVTELGCVMEAGWEDARCW
jgi:hypothetical protein